jgi:hypothetical protein
VNETNDAISGALAGAGRVVLLVSTDPRILLSFSQNKTPIAQVGLTELPMGSSELSSRIVLPTYQYRSGGCKLWQGYPRQQEGCMSHL